MFVHLYLARKVFDVNEKSTNTRLSFLTFSSFSFFYLLDYNLTSKWGKYHKETHEEIISKEEFLDVLNCLVKIQKWAKEIESQKQKDREEKDMFMAEITKLKVDNMNIKEQVKDLKTFREDGEISSLEDIKDKITKVKE